LHQTLQLLTFEGLRVVEECDTKIALSLYLNSHFISFIALTPLMYEPNFVVAVRSFFWQLKD